MKQIQQIKHILDDYLEIDTFESNSIDTSSDVDILDYDI